MAALTGDRTDDAPSIIPFRGDYYTLTPEAATLVHGLVYPVPDPRFPFLGVHFTRRIDGQVWAGPNAVLAFRRTGYRRRDISVRDLAETLANPGFRKLAARYWRYALQFHLSGVVLARDVVLLALLAVLALPARGVARGAPAAPP